MPRNVEIKARLNDRPAVEQAVRSLATSGPTMLRQTDTFFRVSRGRLKLRIVDETQGELIFYDRPDQARPKISQYTRVSIAEPETLATVLTQALGEIGTVRKTRTLYLIGRTRVHLDEVVGLGDYLELEVVLREDEPTSAGENEARG